MVKKIFLITITLLLTKIGLAMSTPILLTGKKSQVKAYYLQENTNPIISISIMFNGGAALDNKNNLGLAAATMAMINEGAGKYNSDEFKATLEDLAININGNASLNSVNIDFLTVSKNKKIAFELLKLALNQPNFESNEWDRVKQQMIASIKNSMETPQGLNTRLTSQAMFGDSVYSHPISGTINTVNNIRTADMKNFVKERFAKDSVYVAIVGDITKNDAEELIDYLFDNLPAKATPWKLRESIELPKDKRYVYHMKTPQTTISFAYKGLARENKSFYAASVLNEYLGGNGLNSLLAMEVREKRGLTYGIYTNLSPIVNNPIWVGSFSTTNANAKLAVDTVEMQMNNLAEKGVPLEDFNRVKTYMTGSFPLRLATNQAISSMLVSSQFYDLGPDYINKRNDYINNVTIEEVNEIAKDFLNFKNWNIIYIGDPQDIKATEIKYIYE